MSIASIAALVRPFELKSLKLKNRIVMAPMTRLFAMNGVPGEDVASYYRRRAENEVGLIISEGTVIDRLAARNEPNAPAFYGEVALAGWKRVIDQVHRGGSKMGPQLWHAGSRAGSVADWDPRAPVESPSGLVAPGMSRGEAMKEEAIADAIAAFGRSAAEAKRLGFDMIEIQGAHGFLVDQFFWDGTNRRADFFGGATLKERARFGAEVVKNVRVNVGPDFPICMRISQWKAQDYSARLAETPDAMAEWLTPLVEAGVDLLHCSARRFWEPEFPDVDGEAGLSFAGWAKKLTGAATIGVGSVGLSGDFMTSYAGEKSAPAGLDRLIQRLEREEFDLVAVGRALLSDPRWAAKVTTGCTEGLKNFDPGAMFELV